MAKVTFSDKVFRREISEIPEINKITADNLNEIKQSINDLYDRVDSINAPNIISITTADFSGENYDNSALVGLTAGETLLVYTGEGSGVLLEPGDGYTFDDALGRLTMSPQKYVIQYYKPVS